MNISLDEEIRKDKEKQRGNRHRHDNNRHHHHHRGRHHTDRDSRDRHNHQERRQHRDPRIILSISNLHYSVTKQQLQEICQKYGRVKSCRIQWDKMGRSNEKATVEYFNRTDSESALENLRGLTFEDQKIQIQLVQDDNMPSRRHDIRKNYGNRFRQYSKPGIHRYK